MLVVIAGESCTGKSTLAQNLKAAMDAQVFTGKDYLRLAKNETMAKSLFRQKLETAVNGENLIYVISEPGHLSLLPEGAVTVRMTADLPLILTRFARRMGGKLPEPVKQMLEKKHGIFDGIAADFHIHNNENPEEVCEKLIRLLPVTKGEVCTGRLPE